MSAQLIEVLYELNCQFAIICHYSTQYATIETRDEEANLLFKCILVDRTVFLCTEVLVRRWRELVGLLHSSIYQIFVHLPCYWAIQNGSECYGSWNIIDNVPFTCQSFLVRVNSSVGCIILITSHKRKWGSNQIEFVNTMIIAPNNQFLLSG